MAISNKNELADLYSFLRLAYCRQPPIMPPHPTPSTHLETLVAPNTSASVSMVQPFNQIKTFSDPYYNKTSVNTIYGAYRLRTIERRLRLSDRALKEIK